MRQLDQENKKSQEKKMNYTRIKKVYANGVATTFSKNKFFKLDKKTAEYIALYPWSVVGMTDQEKATMPKVKETEKTHVGKAGGVKTVSTSYSFDLTGFEVFETYGDALNSVVAGD